MNNKKVTIEQLKEGFLVTDQDEERYAVTLLFPWLEKYFELQKEEPKPEGKKKS